MPKLIIIRGAPGSGKSTMAYKLQDQDPSLRHWEADDYFFIGSKYVFDPRLLPSAHEWCHSSVLHDLRNGNDVVVSNTFTRCWEMSKYMGLGGVIDDLHIEVIELHTEYVNRHGVPEEKVDQMRRRFEPLPADFPWPVQIIKGQSHDPS